MALVPSPGGLQFTERFACGEHGGDSLRWRDGGSVEQLAPALLDLQLSGATIGIAEIVAARKICDPGSELLESGFGVKWKEIERIIYTARWQVVAHPGQLRAGEGFDGTHLVGAQDLPPALERSAVNTLAGLPSETPRKHDGAERAASGALTADGSDRPVSRAW